MVDSIYDQRNTKLAVGKLCGGFPRGYLLRCHRKYCFLVINTQRGGVPCICYRLCSVKQLERSKKQFLREVSSLISIVVISLLLVACLFS